MTAMIFKLGLSGWRSRWLFTLLTFLLITVAAGALMLSLQLRDVAQRPWQETFDATNGAHLVAFGPSRDVEALATLDGVSEAAGPTPTSSLDDRALFHVRAPSDRRRRATGRREAGAHRGPQARRRRRARPRAEFARAIGVLVGDAVELKTMTGSLTAHVVGVSVLAREAPYPDNQPGEG